MREITFQTGGRIMAARDAAIVLEDENPRTALVEAVIQSIGTEVEVTAGGVTLHLAAWTDPEHWSSDWAEKLGDDRDPEAFIAELVIDRGA
jgi:hypothetical protein